MSDSSLRRRLALALVPRVAEGLIRGIRATSRVEVRRQGVFDEVHASGRGVIMAFWHSRLLLVRYAHPGGRLAALISRHDDGELIARTMARFGHAAARGSSTRDGSRALREALSLARDGWDLAITPDGPRGPARLAKPGVVELARMTGFPVVPVSCAARPAATLSSWDRFEVPLPFSRIVHAVGAPIAIARDATQADREAARSAIERELDELGDECREAIGLPPFPPRPEPATDELESAAEGPAA